MEKNKEIPYLGCDVCEALVEASFDYDDVKSYHDGEDVGNLSSNSTVWGILRKLDEWDDD